VSHRGRTLPPGKDPVPIVQEAGWVSGPVWTGAENLAPAGIRSPYRRRQSTDNLLLLNNLDNFNLERGTLQNLACMWKRGQCNTHLSSLCEPSNHLHPSDPVLLAAMSGEVPTKGKSACLCALLEMSRFYDLENCWIFIRCLELNFVGH
jgi:hypothetical protein